MCMCMSELFNNADYNVECIVPLYTYISVPPIRYCLVLSTILYVESGSTV